MYESPIQMISDDIIKDIVEKQNGHLIELVHSFGFDVDKEELKRALLYDRNQWERGYADGKMDGYHLRDVEIVRCKECKYRDPEDKKCDCGHFIRWQLPRRDDWFCADGERRDDE